MSSQKIPFVLILGYIMQSYAWIHSRVEGQRMQYIENTKIFKVFSNMDIHSVTWGQFPYLL